MVDPERDDQAGWDFPSAFSVAPEVEPEPSAEDRPRQRWSAEEKARIVRESFWPRGAG